MQFFATAAKGTEPALRDELRELHLRGVRADRGGVHFEGEMPEAARACLWSRIAVRVLVEVSAFDAPDEDALYDGVRAVEWTRWMTSRTTLAVRATCKSSRMTHSQFVAQRTKDAVVDLLRDRLGERPSVDRDDPDVLLAVHLSRNRATVYLDAGGASLHERGWRRETGDAPLRETLAAAVLRLSGWDREAPLIDPMCGAGTIAIEAAAWAARVAPGLSRKRFGFERWSDHDDAAVRGMQEMRTSARAQRRTEGPRIIARDASARAAQHAAANAKTAGVSIEVDREDVRDLAPLDPPGFVVTNPPYGARLEADEALYAVLARSLRGMHGHTAAILAGTPAIGRAMRREADRWWALYNGPIECRLLVYAIR